MALSGEYAGLYAGRDTDAAVLAALRSHGYYVIAAADAAACDASESGRSVCDFCDYTVRCMAPAAACGGTLGMSCGVWRLSVAMHPSLFDGIRHERCAADYSFFGYSACEALHLSAAEYGVVEGCVCDMFREMSHADDIYKRTILARHAVRVMDYVQRFYDRQFALREDQNNLAVERYGRYADEWMASGRLCRDGVPSAAICAGVLGMSEPYFEDMLLFVTGRTHQCNMTVRRIEAARRMLAERGMSVRCVAESLAFPSEACFRYMYEKLTGMRPEQTLPAGA